MKKINSLLTNLKKKGGVMKKITDSKKLTVISAAVSAILVVTVIFAVVKISSGGLGNTLQRTNNFDLEKSLVRKSIDEVDGLIELADKEKAVVMEIKNKEELVLLDPLFDRAYQNDIVIFLPNQTIIYDVSTKTVRDISSESFYEEVTK